MVVEEAWQQEGGGCSTVRCSQEAELVAGAPRFLLI